MRRALRGWSIVVVVGVTCALALRPGIVANAGGAGPSTGLNGVSCASTTTCVAVGDLINSSSQEITLAQDWNGSSWTTLVTPTFPAGTGAALSAVSCASATYCIAVGYAYGASNTAALAERWTEPCGPHSLCRFPQALQSVN